jgi:MarR family 2-MHQ and catechol resistance regulon transcriptional repressor
MATREHTGNPANADVWLVIRKAAYWLERHALDSVAATGLALSDFAVLKVLLFSGPLPVNVIGAKVLLTSGSITTSVDRLESQGFVRRSQHPTDRRAALVSLTRAGARKIHPASLKHAERMAQLVAVLTPAQQHELVRLIKKLGKSAMHMHGGGPAKLNGKARVERLGARARP